MNLLTFNRYFFILSIVNQFKYIKTNICENERPCGKNSCIWISEWHSFICKCQAEYLSLNKSCSENLCKFNPCLNGGTCLKSNVDNKICQCPKDYSGIFCQFKIVPINPCEIVPNTCLNGAICSNMPYGYMCTCLPGFTGPRCEILMLCDPRFCINGKCAEKDGILKCECDKGWTGPLCNDFEATGCDHNKAICKNGATCKNLENNRYNFMCLCPPGYTGLYCDYKIGKKCLNMNCNNGLCFENLNVPFCECLPGWSGDKCDQKLGKSLVKYQKSCETDASCLNGGKCFYGKCKCKFFFSGQHCEKIKTKLCSLNLCLNGGTCLMLQNRVFCSCRQNFTGNYCENFLN